MYPYNYKKGQTIQTNANGVSVDRAFAAHFQVPATDALLSVTNGVIAAFATSDTDVTEVTTGFTQPKGVKNLTVTAGGTAVDIKAVSVTITGTNYADETITEVMPVFVENTAGTKIGIKAFKTVTSVSVPAMDGAGVTIAVGFGEKLGLPFKLTHNTVLKTFLNNVVEGTAPTVATSATALESNTISLNSALNGSIVDIYLMI